MHGHALRDVEGKVGFLFAVYKATAVAECRAWAYRNKYKSVDDISKTLGEMSSSVVSWDVHCME